MLTVFSINFSLFLSLQLVFDPFNRETWFQFANFKNKEHVSNVTTLKRQLNLFELIVWTTFYSMFGFLFGTQNHGFGKGN